jgi:tRNA dimethylallyltransferase
LLVKPLVVVVGPTAVGKTEIGLYLGEALAGEIVSADSRQVYRGMDIGTAKPTPAEQRQVPHHLIDIRNPDETLSLGEYRRLALAAIAAIHDRGHLPLLVGGTGQYVRAVVEGWQVPEVPPQPPLRAELEALAAREGNMAVFARLQALDPESAARMDPRNLRRVIRALEVTLVLGRPFSQVRSKAPPPFRILQIGLTRPRPLLYARADARIEAMFARGFVDEVRRLLAQGYGPDLPAFSSLGYREVAGYLAGSYSLEEAKALLRRHTRQFIRRQYNWFALNDPAITWFDREQTDPATILERVQAWLEASASW